MRSSLPLRGAWRLAIGATVIATFGLAGMAVPAQAADTHAVSDATFTWGLNTESGDVRKVAGPLAVEYSVSPLAQLTAQPVSASVAEGKLASFTVAATSGSALTYQWESSTDGTTWASVTGATAATYSVVGRLSATGTQYRAAVSDTNGTTRSNAATLTVTESGLTPAVSISRSEFPSDTQTALTVTGTGFDPDYSVGTRPPLAGTSAGVYVAVGKFADVWRPSAGAAAASRPNSDVKWAVLSANVGAIGGVAGGAAVLNADGTFDLTLTVSKDALDAKSATGTYGIYTYAGGGAWQPAFETFTPITFLPLVDITEQPQGDAVAAGQSATFSVEYSSATDATVQWQVSSDNGDTWSDIAEATTGTLSVAATSQANGHLYRAKIVNAGGTEYSAPARLTVTIGGLSITAQPKSVAVVAGRAATFSARAAGQFVTYQWQSAAPGSDVWVPIAEADSRTLTVPASAVKASGTRYRALVSNPAGEVVTSAATLTVTKASPQIAGAPTKKALKTKKKSVVKVTVTASGLRPTGKVKVTWKGTKGKAKGTTASTTVALKNGKAKVTSKKLTKKGTYKVTVSYAGSSDLDKAVKSAGKVTVK